MTRLPRRLGRCRAVIQAGRGVGAGRDEPLSERLISVLSGLVEGRVAIGLDRVHVGPGVEKQLDDLAWPPARALWRGATRIAFRDGSFTRPLPRGEAPPPLGGRRSSPVRAR